MQSRRRRTLYDFVDENKLKGLANAGCAKLAEIEALYQLSAALRGSLDQSFSELSGIVQSTELPSTESSRMLLTAEGHAVQEQEVTAMAEVLMSLARHYDQIVTALKDIESGIDLNTESDLAVLIRDTEELPYVISDMEASLEVVLSLTEQTKANLNGYEAAVRDIRSAFEAMTLFAEKLPEVKAEVEKLEARYERGTEEAGKLFAEMDAELKRLRGLEVGYTSLQVEVQRRRKYDERQQKEAEKYWKLAWRLYEEELHQRRQFADGEGRYLPDELCSALKEPLTPPLSQSGPRRGA